MTYEHQLAGGFAVVYDDYDSWCVRYPPEGAVFTERQEAAAWELYNDYIRGQRTMKHEHVKPRCSCAYG